MWWIKILARREGETGRVSVVMWEVLRPPGPGDRERFSLTRPVWESLCSMFGPMFLLCSLLAITSSVSSLKCFSDPEGLEMSLCEEKRGYRTCFIKYNHSKPRLIMSPHTLTFLCQGARSQAEAAPPRTSSSSRSVRTTWWWGRGWGPRGPGGRGSATVGPSSVTVATPSLPLSVLSSSWPR